MLHNMYASTAPSGENGAVEQDIRDLRKAGVAVTRYTPTSDDLRSRHEQIRAARELPHSRTSAADVRELLAAARPDVAHLHNPFPLLTTSVIAAIKAADIPLVQTLHNYRHGCMRGDHYRDGGVCTDCLRVGSDRPGVQHACYRGSRLQSALFAYARWRSSGAWQLVDGFIVLNEFMRQYALTSLGLPESKVFLRPTTVTDPVQRSTGHRRGFLFAGRLTAEKGLRELLAAWSEPGEHREEGLLLAGEGPLRELVERAAGHDSTVRYVGSLPSQDLMQLLAQVRALVVPSIWYEGFPRIIAESFAVGTPVITFDHGSLGTIIPAGCGWTVPCRPAQLTAALRTAATTDISPLSARARRHYEEALTPEAGMARLLGIYAAVSRKGAR